MPANLTPQYHEADARFKAAQTTREKLEALDEMLAVIPKHKGTEKMQADIKRRIAKLRQKDKSAAPVHRGVDVHIEREGAGQIAIVGPPNSGKSLLVRRLTSAEPDVADYPFTTRRPMPGMMEFEDILIQLVDVPPIATNSTEPWALAIPRSSDAVLLVLDASSGTMLDDIDMVQDEFAKAKVQLIAPDEEPSPGRFPVGTAFRRTVVATNKVDLSGALDDIEVFRELYEGSLPIVPISALAGDGLEDLKLRIFEAIGVVRVYSKVPGKPPDYSRPFVLNRGSTVADFAASVHKEFASHLRFARAWGKHRPDAAMVGRDQQLEDKDVIELHV